MTMPAAVPTVPTAHHVRTIELPAPGYPMVTRMISDPLFPPEQLGAKEEPVTWVVSKPHPLVPEMNVVRMFDEGTRVAVYSVAANGQTGMRNHIPMNRTRLVEEAMPLEIFVDELAIAEAMDDEDDEAPPQNSPPQEPQAPMPETPVAAPPPSNGQPDEES